MQSVLGRTIGALIIAGVVFGAIRFGLFRVPLQFYDLLDDQTLIVRSIARPVAWTVVTELIESADSVTVTVSSISAPLPGPDEEEYSVVTLSTPLGNREVVDGTTGQTIPHVDLEIVPG